MNIRLLLRGALAKPARSPLSPGCLMKCFHLVLLGPNPLLPPSKVRTVGGQALPCSLPPHACGSWFVACWLRDGERLTALSRAHD